ncbi:SHOCT domain-containing protein [Geothrix sp. 21YS21S-2]|uniref:SHOCT domain-containing protein n=1 Tax=Geothrix sp. 21YS21S-2 TaxID=3068893 RepID=UPI0027B9A657|nr:SHOCT domain-containing protein [Geothrix sp. 21YS21S-2]
MRLLPAALALMMIPAAHAAPRRTWDFGNLSYVRRTPAEKGAQANTHPLAVEPAVLAQALASVRFANGPKDAPLFTPAEADAMSKAMAEAFAAAGPGEDLVVLSTFKRESGFFAESLGVTARVFATGGRLNLIVHDTRLDFVYAYNLDNKLPPFDYGYRDKAGAAVLKAPGAEARRADWLVLPLAAPAEKPVPVAATPAAAPAPAPRAAEPVAKAPAAVPASIEERLRGLKRFREQDLITEAEYAKQKQELLKEYAKGTEGKAD